MVQRTLALCAAALTDAGMRPEDVDEIVMVGGSTRIPAVKAAVAAFFGRPGHDEIDPDQVVALGAAVQAGVLGGQVRDALLLDVTPLSLGIETAEGAVSKLIQRNSAIPAEATEGFTTYVDGQTKVKMNIVQGERELARDNRSIGEFILSGIPPMAAGLPKIGVRFRLDADGVLRVRALEERSGAEAEIEVRPKHGLTDEEVERMLADAWSHAAEDMDARRVADLNSQLIAVVRHVKRNLQTAQDQLPSELLTPLDEALEDAEDAMIEAEDLPADGKLANRLKGILDALEDAAFPLAELLMRSVAATAVRDRSVTELLGEDADSER
jgi:molecular chaperone DnaK